MIDEPDFGTAGPPCDLWDQDCPPGNKCISAERDSAAWGATRCSPIVESPLAVGEPCVVAGVDDSLVDECEAGAMCSYSGSSPGGVCQAFCLGTEATPTCADPCSACVISDTTLAFCTGFCSPLAQDCDGTRMCVAYASAFLCAPDVSDDLGAPGDPCLFINVCDPGSYCADRFAIPGCKTDGCCTPFCDVDAPDTCGSALPGTQCTPLFEPGHGVEGCLADQRIVGVCVVPS